VSVYVLVCVCVEELNSVEQYLLLVSSFTISGSGSLVSHLLGLQALKMMSQIPGEGQERKEVANN
jgi:hypothetical protein